MKKLSEEQKQDLINWTRKIYEEVDDVEFPELIINYLYEIACQNEDVEPEFLPSIMPFGKYKGKKIEDIHSVYYLETLLLKQWNTLDKKLRKSLRKRWDYLNQVAEYVASLEDDYRHDMEQDIVDYGPWKLNE